MDAYMNQHKLDAALFPGTLPARDPTARTRPTIRSAPSIFVLALVCPRHAIGCASSSVA
jgi:hypothetical protein